MSTTIHIAPYVRGPSTSAANERETRSDDFNSQAKSVAVNPPLPHPIEESARTFAIEFVLLSAFVGTLAAWIAGVGSSAMLTILAIDGLLAGGLLICYLVRRAAAGNASTNQMSKSQSAPVQWAYRATNYRQLRAMGLPRSAQSLFAQGISSHLMLEAVVPAGLSVGDVILVEAGQTILADGVILEGMAVIDEAMVTGQSAPVVCHEDGLKEVMRESRVLSGMVFVEVTPRRGHPLDWIGSIGATESHKLEAAQP